MKLINKATNNTFTLFLHFVDGMVKNIFGDNLLFSKTINIRLVDRVLVISKWECQIDGILFNI
jgi:hypothetical protein